MSSRRPAARPAVVLASAVVAVVVLAYGFAGPAAASTTVRHPDRDWLGSQVAKHLGPADRRVAAQIAISSNVTYTPGLDVSSWQGNVNWSSVAGKGAKFAYVKATEGTYYTNPYFSQQYTGAYKAGIVHGAYHFATPDTSSGKSQADYFVAHGGGWSKDGKTFPGMLDLEWNPYGADCYGKSKSAMTAWILAFSNEYHAKTTRWPMIYTATSWWKECVGTTGNFSSTNPLVLACYCSSVGALPYAWSYATIWQWADSGTFPGDQDRFTAAYSRVIAMANG